MPMNNTNLNGFTYYPNQNILQRDNITAYGEEIIYITNKIFAKLERI